MPWCPTCKNEYVEGVTVCADCGVKLVEALEERTGSPLIFGEQEQMERLKDFLVYSGVGSAKTDFDPKDGVYELFVNDEERTRAAAAVSVFLKQEKEPEEETKREVSRGVYQNSARLAEENRSSGYMLLVIGGVGLLAVILLFMDIISLPFLSANKYMVCGVMGGLFFLFTVMGILSMKSSKVLEKKAETENNLTSEMRKWCTANLTAEKIDEDLFQEEETGEEIRYFKRTDRMKQMIARQFMNLDEDFLDAFVDDYYPELFD
jgi:hypothetical protein